MITRQLTELANRYDLVVIGSGAAGLVSAARAADAGLTTLVIEKAALFGGTSAVSGGVMWAPNNRLMADAGFADSDEAAAAYLNAAAGEKMSKAEIDWYVATASKATHYLTESTRVRLTPLGRPDYHLGWPGAALGGRSLDNDTFDPSVIPGLAAVIRPPTYFPLISMNERDALNGATIDQQLIAQRTAAGIRTMGGALVGALLASVIDRGVHLVSSARVTDLTRDAEGAWRLAINDGQASATATTVVIASGGFEWNHQLRSALLKFPITPISAPSNEGDGLMLALAAGASIDELTDIWGVPVIAIPGQLYDGKPSGRMANVEMTLPGSITVNAAGQRFVNEALNYHDLSRVFGNVDPRTARLQNSPAWLVFDQAYLNRYSVAGSPPGVAQEWMTSAGSLDELAGRCGIDADGLLATIATFNPDAEVGTDSQFSRGSRSEDRHLGDPHNEPNPCLAPLSTAPFYAVPIHAGVLGTAGGIRVNLNGQVLDRTGQPISGLFAAGNFSATVFRDAYPGGGATVGSAITRAFAIGEFLARPTGRDAE